MLEYIPSLSGNVFEHNDERIPEITSSSESIPADKNFGAICCFSNALDRVPDAIGELSYFRHLRLGPILRVGVRLHAADLRDASRARGEMLELDNEVREDARNMAAKNPGGFCVRTTKKQYPTLGLYGTK